VRIDEPWHNRAAAGVHYRGVGGELDFMWEEAFESDEDDPSLVGGDGGRGDGPGVGLGGAAPRRRPGTGENFGGVADEKISANHRVM
jgi:hypothetical protein